MQIRGVDSSGNIVTNVYAEFTYDGYTLRGQGTLENGSMMVDDSIFTRTVAISQRGNGGHKYQSYMNMGEGNWCMAFVSWALAEAGIEGPKEIDCTEKT